MEDQQSDPGVLTPDADPAVPRKPRWWKLRRRSASEPEKASESTEEAAEAPRVPVGKRKRSAVAAAVAADDTAEDAADDTAGDAADESEAEPDSAEPEPAGDIQDSDTDAGAADSEASEESDSAEESEDSDPAEEPVLVPHRPVSKRWLAAAAVAAALFVGAGAFAGAMAQPYLADRALDDTKLEVARTASEAITTLWTYTPEDMENLPDRAEKYLAGDFSAQYRRFIDAIVATNKQSQVTNNTEVVGTAVESISPTEATAIVYTNSVSTSPITDNVPSLRYLSYRLSMERQNSDWLINRMTAITQLDLTPQL